MKMICNKAKTCPEAKNYNCGIGQPHSRKAMCGSDFLCRHEGDCKCVPVAPRRKPVVVWVIAGEKSGFFTRSAWSSRNIARGDAAVLRRNGWTVRGPIRVVIP